MNLSVGTVEGQWIRTGRDAIGHAIYGPYETLEPGSYVAEFTIKRVEETGDEGDLICCLVDVVIDQGQHVIAWEPVLASQIRNDGRVTLGFDLDRPASVEYRVHVNGRVPLLIADNATAHPVQHGAWSAQEPRTQFMLDHKPMMKRLHDMGVKMAIVGDRLIMEKAGVRFNARIYDDVNFVHELFVVNAYNVLYARPSCVVDVGMNVALASLLFASKPFIEEVHAFEPFIATYERGLANIDLNPELARKIHVNKFGLSDGIDGDVTLNIYDSGDSGAMSTRDIDGGVPTIVPMRDASGALLPIIESAEARGLEVIVKVDCEGSEFAIFKSLTRTKLLSRIRGFLVEWHRVFPGRTQEELLAPLLEAGFLIFDITPPEGNGFFYAVRT